MAENPDGDVWQVAGQQHGLRRLTFDEFAKRVGLSVLALRKIEYSECRPSAQIAD